MPFGVQMVQILHPFLNVKCPRPKFLRSRSSVMTSSKWQSWEKTNCFKHIISLQLFISVTQSLIFTEVEVWNSNVIITQWKSPICIQEIQNGGPYGCQRSKYSSKFTKSLQKALVGLQNPLVSNNSIVIIRQ